MERSQLEELKLDVRVGKLKNGKPAGKDEVTGEMIKGGGDRVLVVMNGEEGLEWEVQVDGIPLEHVLEFKYLGCVLDESGTDRAECTK